MRHIWMLAGAATLALAGAAAAQDAPPPGCRWFGDELGCKDGRGNYRRAGDGEVIGRYAVAKPKPAPRPRAEAAPTEVPPAPGDVAAAEASAAGDVAAAAAAPAAVAPQPPPPEAVAPAQPAKPKPWWQAFWDWLVNDIMSLLRRLGLAK